MEHPKLNTSLFEKSAIVRKCTCIAFAIIRPLNDTFRNF